MLRVWLCLVEGFSKEFQRNPNFISLNPLFYTFIPFLFLCFLTIMFCIHPFQRPLPCSKHPCHALVMLVHKALFCYRTVHLLFLPFAYYFSIFSSCRRLEAATAIQPRNKAGQRSSGAVAAWLAIFRSASGRLLMKQQLNRDGLTCPLSCR